MGDSKTGGHKEVDKLPKSPVTSLKLKINSKAIQTQTLFSEIMSFHNKIKPKSPNMSSPPMKKNIKISTSWSKKIKGIKPKRPSNNPAPSTPNNKVKSI